MKLSSRALFFLHLYLACSMMILACSLKKNAPKYFIKNLNEALFTTCNFTCSHEMFPNNDINTVELPSNFWIQLKCMVEFRHNLTRTCHVEAQLDSLEDDRNIVALCSYYSSDDMILQSKVKGHKAMINSCMETK